MSDLAVTLDGVRGDVKLVISDKDESQTLKFKWFKAEDGSTGFMSNVTKNPIFVTELGAELLIKIVISSLIKALPISLDGIKVFNHLGDKLEDIEFMPPTLDGKEAEIQRFVAKQDSLRNLYSSYEEDSQLSEELILACQEAGVLEDFLSLVQFQLSKMTFTLSNPKE